jgi:hypothetical protein
VRIAVCGHYANKRKVAFADVPEYVSRTARHTGPIAVFEIVMLAVNLDLAVPAERSQMMFPVLRVLWYRLPLGQDEMPGAKIIPAVLGPKDVPFDNSGRERRSVERLNILDFSPVLSIHVNSPLIKKFTSIHFYKLYQKKFL